MPLDVNVPDYDSVLWSSEGYYLLAIVRDGVLPSGISASLVGGAIGNAVGGAAGAVVGAVASALAGNDFVILPPIQQYDDQMESATFIQPTQGPRYYVEGLGIQSKMISVGGTSSVFGGQNALDGSQAMPPLASRTLGLIKSGYVLFHELEEVYMKYQLEAGTADRAGKIELHFFNLKDGEFYQVEPLQFQKTRVANKPLQYQYRISMRVLRSSKLGEGLFDLARGIAIVSTALFFERTASLSFLLPAIQEDVRRLMGSVSRAIGQDIQRLERDVGRVLEVTNAIYDTGNSGPIGTMDALRSVRRAVELGEVSDPSVSSYESAIAFLPTPERMQNIALTTSESLSSSIESETRATRKPSTVPRVDLLDPTIALYGQGLEARALTYMAIDGAPVQDDILVDGPLRVLQRMHEVARSGEGAFPDGTSQRAASIQSARSNNRNAVSDLPTGAAALNAIPRWPGLLDQAVPANFDSFLRAVGVANPRQYSGIYRRVQVSRSHTVYTFAQENLGDWRRWVEVVAINSLKYPYFTEDGAGQTAKYGDTILIPTNDPVLSRDQLARLEQTQLRYDKLAINEIYLGLDIGVDTTSGKILMDGRGEIAMVAGVQAFLQNLIARLSTLVGSYIPHPAWGLGVRVGGKATTLQLMVWKSMLLATIRTDPRVLGVSKAKLSVQGDKVEYDVRVHLRDLDTEVTARGLL